MQTKRTFITAAAAGAFISLATTTASAAIISQDFIAEDGFVGTSFVDTNQPQITFETVGGSFMQIANDGRGDIVLSGFNSTDPIVASFGGSNTAFGGISFVLKAFNAAVSINVNGLDATGVTFSDQVNLDAFETSVFSPTPMLGPISFSSDNSNAGFGFVNSEHNDKQTAVIAEPPAQPVPEMDTGGAVAAGLALMWGLGRAFSFGGGGGSGSRREKHEVPRTANSAHPQPALPA